MDYADRGLWIQGASEGAAQSILNRVGQFRLKHDLRESDWQIRVYAVCSTRLDVWIGKTPNPTYQPYSLVDDATAGQKIVDVLEHFQNHSN